MSYKWNRIRIETEADYAQHGKFYRCAPVPFTATKGRYGGHRRGFTESTMRITSRPRRVQYGQFVVLSKKQNYVGGHDSSCHATNWTIERVKDKVLRPGREEHVVYHSNNKIAKQEKLNKKMLELNARWMTNAFYIKKNKEYILEIKNNSIYLELCYAIRKLCDYKSMLLSGWWKDVPDCMIHKTDMIQGNIDTLQKVLDYIDTEVDILNGYNEMLEKENRKIYILLETTNTRLK